jgi:hypothetical protein
MHGESAIIPFNPQCIVVVGIEDAPGVVPNSDNRPTLELNANVFLSHVRLQLVVLAKEITMLRNLLHYVHQFIYSVRIEATEVSLGTSKCKNVLTAQHSLQPLNHCALARSLPRAEHMASCWPLCNVGNEVQEMIQLAPIPTEHVVAKVGKELGLLEFHAVGEWAIVGTRCLVAQRLTEKVSLAH